MGKEYAIFCSLIIVSVINFSLAGLTKKRSPLPIRVEDMPIWRESPDVVFPSTEKNLPNFEQLRKKLSNYEYDHRYLSVKKPRNNTKNVVLSRKQLLASMPSELKDLHFTVAGSVRELGIRASKKLRLWLWNLSACPVLPLWKDFGETHWPRYVNIGQCSSKKSCSFPSGRTCKPSKYQKIYAFWWFCSDRLLEFHKKKCTWVKYENNVLEKCRCSC